MREGEKGRADKKLDTTVSRSIRHRLPANNWKSRLAAIVGIYSDDRRPWPYSDYLTSAEFTHSVTLIFISAGAFGIGTGELIARAVGY